MIPIHIVPLVGICIIGRPWERQGVILRDGGTREWDGVMANHADVVVCGENAYIFYFTHPFFANESRHKSGYVIGEDESRACIQVAKLEVIDGKLCCDRNQEFSLELSAE